MFSQLALECWALGSDYESVRVVTGRAIAQIALALSPSSEVAGAVRRAYRRTPLPSCPAVERSLRQRGQRESTSIARPRQSSWKGFSPEQGSTGLELESRVQFSQVNSQLMWRELPKKTVCKSSKPCAMIRQFPLAMASIAKKMGFLYHV